MKKKLVKINNKFKENTIKKEKARNAGIDIMRILGMYDIVIFHILINSNIYNKYPKYKNELKFMEVFTNWHISNFGTISGIVGFKHNKHLKYSNLIYLWLIVFFYSLVIHYTYIIYNPYFISSKKTIEYFFPVIYNNHWYFSAYFGMYLFIPLINRGILYLNKRELKIIVLSIISIFIIWKDLNNIEDKIDPFYVNSGRSMIGLIVFYIIGAYLGKYFIIENKNKKIYYYLICIIIFIISGYLCNNFISYYGDNIFKLLLKRLYGCRLNSVAMISQTISLALLFSQIKYNKYIGKFISFFGQLTFGVYIIHDHVDIRYIIFKDLFRKNPYNLTLKSVILLVLEKGLKYFSICIFIELLRFLFFNLIRVKILLSYIDKKIISDIG